MNTSFTFSRFGIDAIIRLSANSEGTSLRL